MSTERLKELLEKADATAGPPAFGTISSVIIARRLRRRRLIAIGTPAAAAALVLIGLAIWHVKPTAHQPHQQDQLATLSKQVEQLQAQTDATLKLLQEVLAKDRQRQKLAALEAELASIADPIEEMNEQMDKTAFTLVYQADRLYRELKLTDSAVEAYKGVIQLYPESRWAEVARERLAQIESRRFNMQQPQGEQSCELAKV